MKRTTKIIYTALYLLLAIATCIWVGIRDDYFFRYLTHLGNLYCAFLMGKELYFLLKHKKESQRWLQWEFAGLILILLIGGVYNTLLGNPFTLKYWTNYSSIILHLLLPVLYSVYFFKNRSLSQVNRKGFILCLALPLMYVIGIYLRIFITKDAWFPYFFMDYTSQGVWGVIAWIVVLAIIFSALGSFLIHLGRRQKG